MTRDVNCEHFTYELKMFSFVLILLKVVGKSGRPGGGFRNSDKGELV